MDWRTLVLAVALAMPALAGAAELETAEQIDACYRKNFPEDSSVQTVSMNAHDRIGAVTTSKATIYWKKFENGYSRILMRFFKPAEMHNAGLLMIEKKDRNDMFIYLPELRRVKRVTKHMTSASMFGTDFSYEEFERLQGIATRAPVSRLPDESTAGRPAYVVEVKPDSENSSYERIKTWIDKETCVALRAEFYERGDSPRKVMTADPDKVAQEGGIWMAREILMQDKRDETQTSMIIEKIEVGAKIPRKMFSEKELVQAGN